jgi:hypothetical protein
MTAKEYRQRQGLNGSKYRNHPTMVAGIRFSSKLEARRYVYWMTQKSAGLIAWFTRQVPFYLPGNVIYRCDFLIIHKPGLVTVEDCKGYMTPVSCLKIKQVEDLYGLEVHIVTKENFP